MRTFIGLLLVAACVAFFPSDIQSPRVPTHKINHEFQTKGNSSVKYTVEHHENVISLEWATGLERVSCKGNVLFMTFSNQSTSVEFLRHLQIGNIVVGGAQLGCLNATTGKRSVIVRSITSNPTLSGSTITIRTAYAGITDVLKNAQSALNLNPIEMQAMASCNTGDLVTGHCTTSLSASHAFQGWKYDYSGHKFWQKTLANGVNADITCTSCYAQFIPTLSVQLGISNNNLNMLELQLQGAATVQIQITAAIRASYSTSGSVPITTLNLPSVTFFIGAFPVNLDFNVPITLDWSFTASASAVISTGVTVTDTVMGGMKWDGRSWTPEKSNNFQVSVQQPAAQVSASATFKVALTPKLDITFEDVATLGIAIAPYVEIDASASNLQLKGSVYGGIDVALDGDLGVTIDGVQIGPQQKFGPQQVYDYKQAVWSG